MLCHSSEPGRKRLYYGGYSLGGHKKLNDKVSECTKNTNANTQFIINMGTNDLLNINSTVFHRPQELVRKYKELAKNIKEKSNSQRIAITAILPNAHDNSYQARRKNWVNYLTQKMAEEESIAFENFGACFVILHYSAATCCT